MKLRNELIKVTTLLSIMLLPLTSNTIVYLFFRDMILLKREHYVFSNVVSVATVCLLLIKLLIDE
jgi:hypothetical protein